MAKSRIIDTLKICFRYYLDDVLDDPTTMEIFPGTAAQWYARMSVVADFLGFDIDKLLVELGSDFEVKRLREIIGEQDRTAKKRRRNRR